MIEKSYEDSIGKLSQYVADLESVQAMRDDIAYLEHTDDDNEKRDLDELKDRCAQLEASIPKPPELVPEVRNAFCKYGETLGIDTKDPIVDTAMNVVESMPDPLSLLRDTKSFKEAVTTVATAVVLPALAQHGRFREIATLTAAARSLNGELAPAPRNRYRRRYGH